MSAIHFLNMTVDLAERFLLGFEVGLGMLYDNCRRKTRQRYNDQCHQGQLPGDPDHHVQNTDDRNKRGKDLLYRLVQ